MHRYKLMFAEYPLRAYEREMALWELQELLPDARVRCDGEEVSVHTETLDGQAHKKLRKLTFFSKFRKCGRWIATNQSVLEAADRNNRLARNVRYFSHSLHEYKGRFYPQLCKSLINISGGEGVVLDPFCGCGTLLFESALNGVQSVGVDINPVGHMISQAKVSSLRMSQETLNKMRNFFYEKSDNSVKQRGIPLNGRDMDYLRRWFPEKNLVQIIQLDDEINSNFSEEESLFLRVVLSEILKIFSWQSPDEQRIRRRKDTPPSNVREFFCERLFQHLDKISILNGIRKPYDLKAEAMLGDARNLPLASSSIDFVVSSPPYATALPYIDADRLSLYLFALTNKKTFNELGRSSIGNREILVSERKKWEEQISSAYSNHELPINILDFLSEIRDRNARANVGFRRRNTAALLYKYFIDMRDSLGEIMRVLKSKGKASLVVGNNFTVAGGVPMEIPTAHFINTIANNMGIRVLRKIYSSTPSPYNIYSKNAIRRETISILEMP